MSEVICHGGAAWTVLFNQTSQLHKFSAVEPEQQQSVSPAHRRHIIHSFPLSKLSVIREFSHHRQSFSRFSLSFGGFSFNVEDVLPPQENKLYLFKYLNFFPLYFKRYFLFKQDRKTVHGKNRKKKRKMLLVWFTKLAVLVLVALPLQ